MGFVFVEVNLGVVLYIGIEDLFDDKESVFDVVDFLKCGCKIVLLGIGCEFLE